MADFGPKCRLPSLTLSGLNRVPMHSLRTFNPRRLFGDEGVADVLRDARVGAAGEDPGAGGLGGLQQPLPKAPVVEGGGGTRIHVKILKVESALQTRLTFSGAAAARSWPCRRSR